MDEIILVVDDDGANLMLAQKILGKEYRIAAANSGEAAFRYLERNKPDLILLDINMPHMDGFEAFEKLKGNEAYAGIPVIFLTAENSAETETKCFQAGAVDFVGKPFVPDVLISRVNRTLELERYHNSLENTVEQQTAQIKEIQACVIVGMANLIESRDGSTGKHVKNTQTYVRLIADELKKRGMFADCLDEEYIKYLCDAAPLHDVGKIKVPDSILQKPGRLTDEEFAVIKTHTTYGREIIEEIISDVEDEKYVRMAEDIAFCHHERWDGMGYPRGISGEEIPLCARIMAIADVFDALYEERCYKPPIRPMHDIMKIMEEGKGTQFDPVILEVFLSMEEGLKDFLDAGKEKGGKNG